MARWKPDDDRTRKIGEQLAYDGPRRRLPAGFIATRQFADDNARRLRERAALAQLRNHPVDPVGALPHFFQEQDTTAWRLECERRPERRLHPVDPADKEEVT